MKPNSLSDNSSALCRASGRAADSLVARLEAMIAAGELADGSRLPSERDLMQRFSTSRTVVREAIATLSNQGLLQTRPRFRPVVRKPGYDTALRALGGVVEHLLEQQGGIKNLYESRIFLEAALVRNAALNARRDDIQALRVALEENRAAIDDSDLFYASDVAFHAVLYRIPRNPIYPGIQKAYVAWLSGYWQAMKRSPEINRLNFAGHEAIFAGILDRDPDAAEMALNRHLQTAWEYVRSTFPEQARQ